MLLDVKHPQVCDYCHSKIDLDFPGFGYYLSDNLTIVYFHLECMNVFEGVAVA